MVAVLGELKRRRDVDGVKEEVPCRKFELQLDQQQHQLSSVLSGKRSFGNISIRGVEPTSVVICPQMGGRGRFGSGE